MCAGLLRGPWILYSGYILQVQFFANLKESAPEVMFAINTIANDLFEMSKEC